MKYVKYLSLIALVILLSGCGASKKSYTKTCSLTNNDVINGYKLVSEYKVYATGDAVDKVVTVEVVSSDNEDTLDYFEEYLKKTYETLNSTYGGYQNTVTKEDGKVVSETTVDYSKMDLEQYVKDNSSMKNYVNKDNKLLVDGVLSTYEALGATCEG